MVVERLQTNQYPYFFRFTIQKTQVMINDPASAMTMDHQIPFTPKINGIKITQINWKPIVRIKEIKADISPLFKAVKKEEPKIEKPQNR